MAWLGKKHPAGSPQRPDSLGLHARRSPGQSPRRSTVGGIPIKATDIGGCPADSTRVAATPTHCQTAWGLRSGIRRDGILQNECHIGLPLPRWHPVPAFPTIAAMRVSTRNTKVVFFVTLGACLVAVAVALNVGWIILNWREVAVLVLGIVFFLAIIAGLILNTIFL